MLPLIENPGAEWPDRYTFFHPGRWAKEGAPGRWAKGNTDPEQSKYKRFAVRSERWRLVGQKDLYDIDADPGEATNVIDDHPEIARHMQDALDAWWAEVEPTANELQRIIIGSDEENPMMLSACEWRDVFVDQQRQVRDKDLLIIDIVQVYCHRRDILQATGVGYFDGQR